MTNTSNRPSIIRSKTISNRKINSLIKQLKNIPDLWKKRLIHDEWQLVITDKMPQKYGGETYKVYADGNLRQIWLNANDIDLYGNIMYKAFAYYVIIEYAQIKKSNFFKELIKRKEIELKIFTRFRENILISEEIIFTELFAFIIETKGNNTFSAIDEIYQYVKKWVYGQIFERKLLFIPNYLEIGIDVIDEQIETIDRAFQLLPRGIQYQFLNDKWKIRISKEKIKDENTSGLCSSFEEKIFIKSSSPQLQKTVWHEFGHYLDRKEQNISRKIIFSVIYNREKEKIHCFYENDADFKYAISNKTEYFADTFALYMLNPKKLRECAYETYNFIDNVLKRWE